jgi:hypothetical protein
MPSQPKLTEADIRLIMESGDVYGAMEVLRDGMKATRSIRSTDDNGRRIYKEIPDFGTRVTCARLLLEWGFGKPAQKTKLEIEKTDVAVETPAQIVAKMKKADLNLDSVTQVYLANAVDGERSADIESGD